MSVVTNEDSTALHIPKVPRGSSGTSWVQSGSQGISIREVAGGRQRDSSQA